MNLRTIRIIMMKDLKEVAQNKGAWIPAAVLPLVFMVLLPVGLILSPQLMTSAGQNIPGQISTAQIRDFIAPFLGGELNGLNDNQAWVVLTTGYMLAPFLLIMPLMLSTIIGAESFVGEKERKTLEALIYTPASDGELFVAKVLASVLPAIALGWVSFLLYGVTVNIASWPVMGHIWFPTLIWLPLMLWLTPAIATLGMAVTVLISIRTKTFMEAYQMSGSLVIVVLGLVAGQISGVLFLSVGVSLLLGLGIFIVDAILIRFGVRTFARSSLLSRI
jgi:ABC-2 type transport system permease protein